MPSNHPWPDERFEALKDLLAQGQSATQIGVALGVSRNAVIGKTHRNGLTFVTRPGLGEHHKKKRRRRPALNGWRRQGETMQPQVSELEPETVAEPVTFWQLEPQHCRWPVAGQGYQTLFCGADALDKHPYCCRHCRIAHQGKST